MFGHTGSGPGCFKDPAGLAVDRLRVVTCCCYVRVCTENHVCLFSSRKSSTFQCGEHVGGGQQEPQIVPPRPQREISHRGLVWIELYRVSFLTGAPLKVLSVFQ